LVHRSTSDPASLSYLGGVGAGLLSPRLRGGGAGRPAPASLSPLPTGASSAALHGAAHVHGASTRRTVATTYRADLPPPPPPPHQAAYEPSANCCDGRLCQ